MKNLIILAIAIVAFAACSSNQPAANNASNSNAPANKSNTAAPATEATPASNSNANSNANANKSADLAAKTDDSGPKRVMFAKGSTESTEMVTLAPGATKQFILGATGAQTLFITPGSDQLTFRIVRGIAGELIKADDGTYSAETKGNNGVKGDIVFEVKNPTKSEIKSKLVIAIEDFAD